MEWHWTDDKESICVKTKPHIPIDERKQPEPMEMDEVKLEESTDSAMLEGEQTEQKIEQLDSQISTQDSQPSAPSASSTMPPPPSPNLWNEFKTAILAMDPDNPIFALPIEGTTDFDLSTLFPELPLYEPPQPNDADAYIDELEYGRVVPVTKFISQKMNIKKKVPPSRKRTAEEAFVDSDILSENVPQLPKHEKYDNTQYLSRMYSLIAVFFKGVVMLTNICGILALFALRKAKDTPATQPPTPQPPNPAINRHPPTWSDEDDVCLITLIVQYSFNWSLICDAFNSIRRPITGEQRTAYECHERWRQNNLTSLSGQVNAG